jgi:hypothetical protein
VRISCQWVLVATALSLVSGTASALAKAVDPSKLPKVECSSLRYSKEFLDKYPKAPAACLEARVYNGKTYMKVKAKVYIVDKSTPTVSLLDPYSNTLGTITIKHPESLRVIVNGKDVEFSTLSAGEVITVWVPESLFSPEPTA